ncbi:uncharacterized protein si:ch211-131k2.2 [Phycodurus eques]|uniref:uncharacterized protein si:ch211-131k2.2 n=1 Tax=Phycodurus eques TaxID=693459 RepID=UPI002ACE8620|nr:uncharacterized protein si:ch211-131k2.2 [Phycodurus eques]
MDTRQLQYVFMLFCTLVQIHQGASRGKEEEQQLLQDWQGLDKSLESTLLWPIATLVKRSKPYRFYGLMGKRSGNKDLLVSQLRGNIPRESASRRALSAPIALTHILEKPHKQGLPKVWVQLLYRWEGARKK